jgi:PEP-CTERM/exosortase A-associated glycosyltransferase
MGCLGKRLQEVIEIERPDVLHVHSPILNAVPALWVGRKLGIPVIYEIRAFWEDAAADNGNYRANSWKYKMVRYLEGRICKNANKVAVICRGLKDDLTRRGISPSKVAVVPNGVTVEDFNNSVPDESFLDVWKIRGKRAIGFIGSFYRYEGLDTLIDAFNRLSATRSDLALVLVGGGPVEGELKMQINRLNLQDKVIIPGRIANDRVPGIYAVMDVMVYPRCATRLTELVTPLKPLEAMAAGKTVIASDVGGHRELIMNGKTGLLYPADSSAMLVETLNRVLGDDHLCRFLAEEGRKWVREERTWDNTTESHTLLYSAVVDKLSTEGETAIF